MVESISNFLSGSFWILLILALTLLFYVLLRLFYKKSAPDEAMIVYGKRKFWGKKSSPDSQHVDYRIIRGAGSFVFPTFETYSLLSLKLMTLEVDLTHVYTSQGIPINVHAVAQVKIGSSTELIQRAAEGFLGVEEASIRNAITQTMAGHLRAIVGTLSVDQLYRDQEQFQDQVRNLAEKDLSNMGFEIKSFVFHRIFDEEGYLDALGQPKIQQALKDARIAKAITDRDAKLEEENARQEKEQRRFSVDVEIAEAERSLKLKQAAIQKEVGVADAQAKKTGEMELKIQNISIANKEVERQRLELDATIREKANAKKYEAERLADAERYKVEMAAQASLKKRELEAEAVKLEGIARSAATSAEGMSEAEVAKAKGIAEAVADAAKHREIGLAEAQAIQAKGEAEAEARRKLAEAFKQYNDAALSIEALKILPELTAAISEPLSRAGSTTIISQGGEGKGTGTAKLSEDVVAVMAQLAPALKQLSGVDLNLLLRDVSRLPGALADHFGKDAESPKEADLDLNKIS